MTIATILAVTDLLMTNGIISQEGLQTVDDPFLHGIRHTEGREKILIGEWLVIQVCIFLVKSVYR